jgi:hypothetical protein
MYLESAQKTATSTKRYIQKKKFLFFNESCPDLHIAFFKHYKMVVSQNNIDYYNIPVY